MRILMNHQALLNLAWPIQNDDVDDNDEILVHEFELTRHTVLGHGEAQPIRLNPKSETMNLEEAYRQNLSEMYRGFETAQETGVPQVVKLIRDRQAPKPIKVRIHFHPFEDPVWLADGFAILLMAWKLSKLSAAWELSRKYHRPIIEAPRPVINFVRDGATHDKIKMAETTGESFWRLRQYKRATAKETENWKRPGGVLSIVNTWRTFVSEFDLLATQFGPPSTVVQTELNRIFAAAHQFADQEMRALPNSDEPFVAAKKNELIETTKLLKAPPPEIRWFWWAAIRGWGDYSRVVCCHPSARYIWNAVSANKWAANFVNLNQFRRRLEIYFPRLEELEKYRNVDVLTRGGGVPIREVPITVNRKSKTTTRTSANCRCPQKNGLAVKDSIPGVLPWSTATLTVDGVKNDFLALGGSRIKSSLVFYRADTYPALGE